MDTQVKPEYDCNKKTLLSFLHHSLFFTVILGLDPRIHYNNIASSSMDTQVKPEYDVVVRTGYLGQA